MRRQLLVATMAIAALSACGENSAIQAEPVATDQVSTAPASESPTTAEAPDTTSGATTTPDTAPATPTAPEVLQFTAPLLGGGSLDFTQFAGRTVALWFWAPT